MRPGPIVTGIVGLPGVDAAFAALGDPEVHAKILIDLDLTRALAEHTARGAEATMVVRPDPNAERWGSQQLAAEGRIVRLLGREPPVAVPDPVTAPLMFTGVHFVQPRL